ncbi:alpha/beta hydrolase [Asticcacaulis sp. DXS10W]|uniref:Proline iminopeptidase n=1 Tax=Asticcacaulis currens TaxID=2984210 RepID=A0ABT5IEE8_9CAUL|nr:alpha/beta hydrolase [Asticcacaulis currens]MDC7694225.1 alpha/beta hydrolase [Asticcacaulis currens]
MKFRYLIAAVSCLYSPPAFAADPATDPIAKFRSTIGDFQRITTPDGVEENFTADINGTKQFVSVRGNHRGNPLILFIHGGPGAPELPISWAFQRPWEEYFTVVQWEQRASGKTWPLNDSAAIAPTLTIEQYRDDAIALIEQLIKRYGKRKVIVIGHSWGSIPGLMTAIKRPDIVHAYVGIGQIIDFREGERIGYEQILKRAREDNNAQAVTELESLEPYPGNGAFDVDKITVQRKWSIHYGYLTAGRDNPNAYFAMHHYSPAYDSDAIKAWGEGSAFTIERLLPKLADVSFKDVKSLKVPVYMFLGRHDYTTPSDIVDQWVRDVRAPDKLSIWFEDSAHTIPTDEPGKALLTLVTHVRQNARGPGEHPAPLP